MAALPTPEEPLTDGVVVLRRFTFDDVPAVTEACQDPEISRWTAGIPQPYTEVHARGWIGLHDRFWNEQGRAPFAFCDARSGQLLGSMALAEVSFEDRSAIAGYWAALWARNRGATTRALKLAARWGFEALRLDFISLTTLPGNVASERVAVKAGFAFDELLTDYKPPNATDSEARLEVKRWILRAED